MFCLLLFVKAQNFKMFLTNKTNYPRKPTQKTKCKQYCVKNSIKLLIVDNASTWPLRETNFNLSFFPPKDNIFILTQKQLVLQKKNFFYTCLKNHFFSMKINSYTCAKHLPALDIFCTQHELYLRVFSYCIIFFIPKEPLLFIFILNLFYCYLCNIQLGNLQKFLQM